MEQKPKRKRKPRTPEQKRIHAERERERRRMTGEDGASIEFTCEACGGAFRVPDGISANNSNQRFRAFVRLGGRVVCEVCARERFRRRRDPWGVNPDAIR